MRGECKGDKWKKMREGEKSKKKEKGSQKGEMGKEKVEEKR